jgi:hypothetical protein
MMGYSLPIQSEIGYLVINQTVRKLTGKIGQSGLVIRGGIGLDSQSEFIP